MGTATSGDMMDRKNGSEGLWSARRASSRYVGVDGSERERDALSDAMVVTTNHSVEPEASHVPVVCL